MSADNLEFLVRKNAKGIDTQSAGRSSKISIDTAHLNASCYGVSDLAMALIDARVCGDESQHRRLHKPGYKINSTGRIEDTGGLFDDIFRQVVDLSIERRWPTTEKGKDRLRKLTDRAIDQIVSDPVCSACGGTRYINIIDLCDKCGGTGKKRLIVNNIAKELEIDPTTWRRTWHSRYADIVAMIETIMHDAARKIRYRTYR
jgi:hypothetical protein